MVVTTRGRSSVGLVAVCRGGGGLGRLGLCLAGHADHADHAGHAGPVLFGPGIFVQLVLLGLVFLVVFVAAVLSRGVFYLLLLFLVLGRSG